MGCNLNPTYGYGGARFFAQLMSIHTHFEDNREPLHTAEVEAEILKSFRIERAEFYDKDPSVRNITSSIRHLTALDPNALISKLPRILVGILRYPEQRGWLEDVVEFLDIKKEGWLSVGEVESILGASPVSDYRNQIVDWNKEQSSMINSAQSGAILNWMRYIIRYRNVPTWRLDNAQAAVAYWSLRSSQQH